MHTISQDKDVAKFEDGNDVSNFKIMTKIINIYTGVKIIWLNLMKKMRL